MLYQELNAGTVRWGCKFSRFDMVPGSSPRVRVDFAEGGTEANRVEEFDLLVGADGIWSKVRQQLMGAADPPLRYLGVMVILGRAPTTHSLGQCIFQTMDGNTRIYAMPFTPGVMMWQLSFPMDLSDAVQLSARGGGAPHARALPSLPGPAQTSPSSYATPLMCWASSGSSLVISS